MSTRHKIETKINKIFQLSFLIMISAQVYSSEDSIETWFLKNQDQNQAIRTLLLDAESICEIYMSPDESSFERLPQALKDKFPQELVDGDTVAVAELKIKCTAEGFYYSELKEVKIWKDIEREQERNACFLVNDSYSLFWGDGASIVTRIDHTSINNLDPEAKLLASMYGFGYGYLSKYGLPLPPGSTLLDKYRQQGQDTWFSEIVDDRITITTYRDGKLLSKRILNPQKNYQMEYYQYYKNGIVYEDSQIFLQEIAASGKNFWLPQEIRTTIYKPRNAGPPWLYMNKTISIRNLQLNIDIPDTVFRQESVGFPPETGMIRKGVDGKEFIYICKNGSFIESRVSR